MPSAYEFCRAAYLIAWSANPASRFPAAPARGVLSSVSMRFESHLFLLKTHQQQTSRLRPDHALLGKSPTWTGKPSRNPGESLDAAGSLSRNFHAASDGCAGGHSPASCGVDPGKPTGESSRFQASTAGRQCSVAVRRDPGRLQLTLLAGFICRSLPAVSAPAGPAIAPIANLAQHPGCRACGCPKRLWMVEGVPKFTGLPLAP
jgi:hypothetical protein